MNLLFTNSHGDGNDFLLTWREHAPANDLPAIARAIRNRNTGDGTSIGLLNADRSGTRCAAALVHGWKACRNSTLTGRG